MLWNTLTRDGMDATDCICRMIIASKFYDQLHVVLLNGITFGGFNFCNIKDLSERLSKPVIAVMRKKPNFTKIRKALDKHFKDDVEERWKCIEDAGKVHTHQMRHLPGCVLHFQVAG